MSWLERKLGFIRTWEPTYSAGGSMTYTSVTTNLAQYIQIGKLVVFEIRCSGTTGGSAGNNVRFTLPVTPASTDQRAIGLSDTYDGTTAKNTRLSLNGSNVLVQYYDSSNYGTPPLTVEVRGFGAYLAA